MKNNDQGLLQCIQTKIIKDKEEEAIGQKMIGSIGFSNLFFSCNFSLLRLVYSLMMQKPLRKFIRHCSADFLRRMYYEIFFPDGIRFRVYG
jgi:hypothetical protein